MRRIVKKLLLLSFPLAIAGCLAFCYARFIEPNLLTVTTLDVPCKSWPSSGSPVKIVLAADFHLRPGDQARLKKIVNAIVRESPDLVLLDGDYYYGHRLKDSMHPAEMARILEPLCRMFPVYAVTGNHELYCGLGLLKKEFEAVGVQFIERQSLPLKIKGEKLQLVGISDMSHKKKLTPGDIPSRLDTGIPMMALTHSPDAVPYLPEEIDLTLAGHTHGGQICLPGGIPLVSPTRIGRHYVYGDLHYEGKRVFITRGLGCSLLPIRLFSPPEILVLNLVPPANRQ